MRSANAMKTRQTELLNFLNNPVNKEFTDKFLKQEGMKDFFGQRDGIGPILGSHYFYNMCSLPIIYGYYAVIAIGKKLMPTH